MMETALLLMTILTCVLLSLLSLSLAVWIWRNRKPQADRERLVLEADHVELKAYTHGSINELRNLLHAAQLKRVEAALDHAERLAWLEAQMDGQTKNLVRLLDIAEQQIRSKETPNS